MAGTIEAVALELARALEPLGQRLATLQGAAALFAELGLPLPPAVQTAIETAPQLPGIVTDVAVVAAEIPTLVAAIAAQDTAATAAGRIAPPARRAFTAVRALAERVNAAFPADQSQFTQEVRDLIAALPERLVGWIVVAYLEQRRPVLLRSVALPGILESTVVPAADNQPALTRPGDASRPARGACCSRLSSRRDRNRSHGGTPWR